VAVGSRLGHGLRTDASERAQRWLCARTYQSDVGKARATPQATSLTQRLGARDIPTRPTSQARPQ
jgi:hypothetical protein